MRRGTALPTWSGAVNYRIAAGDVAGLVREHTAVLLRCALGLARNMVDAEELVQQTFTTFLEARKRFKGNSTVRTFLFGILYKKALEHGRKKSREIAADTTDAAFENQFSDGGMWKRPPDGPEDVLASKELGARIEEALAALPPLQSAVFHLKEVEREPVESICRTLNISEGYFRVLMFRARVNLRELITRADSLRTRDRSSGTALN
ncbi:MAG: sigma-70 family RNA polymerase sigma factor [Elusimicrobiota bacterium]